MQRSSLSGLSRIKAVPYGKNPSGGQVNADLTGDGVISISKAHTYAKNNDSRGEHPQIGSCVTGASNTTL